MRTALFIISFTLLVLSLSVAYQVQISRHSRTELRHVAVSTNKALCALRHDYDVRIEAGDEFLKTHPHGIPGISKATLQFSIKNLKATRKALEGLNCSSKPVQI